MTPSRIDPPPARRHARRVLLHALLLTAAIFAAWQAHELWFPAGPPPVAPPAPNAQHSRMPATRPRARTRPAARLATRSASAPATNRPESPLDDLLEESSVRPLEDDSLGVPPPVGAVRRWAHVLPDGSEMARYEWAGSVEDAARHYDRSLAAEGGKLLNSSTGDGGWQHRSYEAPGRRVVAALRRDPADAKMVDIEITVIRAK
jgi:hypothetical protein